MAGQLHGLLQSKGYSISLAWTESSSEGRWSKKNKAELVEETKRFWLTVVATKCQKYIRHLRKVIPGIIELNGSATGYWFILLWFCCIQSNSIHWAGTPLCCCMSVVSLHQGFTTNRWSHVVVCTGRKQFTILEFELCWGVVLWIDRKKHMEVCGEKPGMFNTPFSWCTSLLRLILNQ